MTRTTGKFKVSNTSGEQVRAFVPYPLPPKRPVLQLEAQHQELLLQAEASIQQLGTAAKMVPSADWFIYGFVRKEAVVSSQIEGTQATLQDVLNFEATQEAERPDDVEEICNYVDALAYARDQVAKPRGLPISTRLLCETHKRLMAGVRGAEMQPGKVRKSQNWVGGTRPGNANFVPPPADEVPKALADLEQWIHGTHTLPPLVRIALAHVQFETIHPFLDGNGRIGRLLVTLLLEHWQLLDAPLLYISLALKSRQQEYYDRLSAVRHDGDWESWLLFFFECVIDAARNGTQAAERMFQLIHTDRRRLLDSSDATLHSIRLFESLPQHPIITTQMVVDLLATTKPTAAKAIEALEKTGVISETSGKKRDRVYAYTEYLSVLGAGTDLQTR
ncbi:MAG: Fic family protein [Aureliella sp.]